jgi:hypothetical protein
MATWKKVIVSGSNVSQLNNDAGYLTSATSGKAFSSASYDGTSLLADSSAGNLSFASGSGQGLTISASVSNDTLTFGLSRIPNSSLANTGSIIGNTSVALGATVTTIDGLTLTGTSATGSFTGSFAGNGSGLIGIVSASYATTASYASIFTVDDKIIFSSSRVEIGGTSANASGANSIAIGLAPNATGNESIALGYGPEAKGDGSIAIGLTAKTLDPFYEDPAPLSIAIGSTAIATGTGSIALGYNAKTKGTINSISYTNAIAIGGTARAAGDYSIAIGDTATADTNYGINIGNVFYGNSSTGNASISNSLTVTGSIVTNNYISASSYVSASAFIGDGSQLTGIAATLNISGSTGSGSVALKTQGLSIVGTNNEIETDASGQTVTIGLPSDVTIGNNLIVTNNLTVFGTASFQNTTNLEVADRFILLASGSNTTGDGGLVVQQGTQNVGELLGWDAAVSRWALTGSFSADSAAFTPDAYISAVTTAAGTSPAPASRYNAVGNIYVSSGDESIWIYS